MSTTLNEYFQNSDEVTREKILEDIIVEINGYDNQDLAKIELNDYYIEKIIEVTINYLVLSHLKIKN